MPITICFYSYKGGTGRTALLARIARETIKRQYRVCCVDFDIEAPGFEAFFKRNDELVDSSILPVFLNQTFWALKKELKNDLSAISTKTEAIDVGMIDEFQYNFLKTTGAEELRHAVRNFTDEVLNPNDFHFLFIDNRTGLTSRAENLFYFADSIVFVFRPDFQNFLIIKKQLLSYFNNLMRNVSHLSPNLHKICVVLNLIPNLGSETANARIEKFLDESGLKSASDNDMFRIYKIPFFEEVFYDERKIFDVDHPVFEEITQFLLT